MSPQKILNDDAMLSELRIFLAHTGLNDFIVDDETKCFYYWKYTILKVECQVRIAERVVKYKYSSMKKVWKINLHSSTCK